MESAVQSIPEHCQKLYVSTFEPAIEQVCVKYKPYVEAFDRFVKSVKAEYGVFQQSFATFVSSVGGLQVARVAKIASEVFPEIGAFLTAVFGQTVVPFSILSIRAVAELSPALVSFASKNTERARAQAIGACSAFGRRLIQGAVVTSLVAGALLVVKGALINSFPIAMGGLLYFMAGFAAKDKVIPQQLSVTLPVSGLVSLEPLSDPSS